MSIRTYAVNCNDAWLNTEGDDISGSYVKYKDHQEVVAALEAKCAALAADNEKAMEAMRQADAAVKLAHEKFSALAEENAKLKKFCKDAAFDADYEAELGMERGGFSDAINEIKTQATDAFLSEVRAQGVDMARNAMIDFVDGEVGPNKNVPGLIRGAEICVSIAEQLRKGGNQ